MKLISLIACFWLTAALLPGQPPSTRGSDLVFSAPGGFYAHPVSLQLESPGALVFYTTDGSTPGPEKTRYAAPIEISRTTVVRAIAIRPDGQRQAKTHTFFIADFSPSLPVVSVSIAPKVLFDAEKGLFVQGNAANTARINLPGANFWSREEVVANVELFEPSGACVHNSLTGLRMFGGMSRLFPQKSLALVARKKYGASDFDYPVFGPEGPSRFDYLVLRNGGSDFYGAHFRDALITQVVKGWDLDVQASRPARVYLNGVYWGIYNIREKINGSFIAAHHPVDRDSVDLLEHLYTIKKGSRVQYQRLLEFLETHDLADPAHYSRVASEIEVSNFIDHQIAQIYFDNQDAGGNIRFWRARRPGARWRWILFDTDWGMGLHDSLAYRNNSLAFHTTADGPAWPNPPWSTFMLRKLLENPEFRSQFLNRFADHLNASLQPERVLARIEAFHRQYQPEMPRHTERWGQNLGRWEKEVEALRTFARKRPAFMWRHLGEAFEPGSPVALELAVSKGGEIVVNKHLQVHNVFQGWYFASIPVDVEAIPAYGYRFSHWEGTTAGQHNPSMKISLARGAVRLQAVFEPAVHALAGKLVINEICPAGAGAGDWVELFNDSRKPVSLKGIELRDQLGHSFVFPDVVIGAKAYLIVSKDPDRFRKAFPGAHPVTGPLPYGLNRYEEGLYLYGPHKESIDSVAYCLSGEQAGAVLSLKLPSLDNQNPTHWSLLPGSGTPNAPNPFYLESRIFREQKQIIQLGILGSLLFVVLILYIFRQKEPL
ncbi:MAG: CotH kinase family protein [Haliscomenobacter sp.]|nr:CotH kinase family protein [Haliscomenobacter sp.]